MSTGSCITLNAAFRVLLDAGDRGVRVAPRGQPPCHARGGQPGGCVQWGYVEGSMSCTAFDKPLHILSGLQLVRALYTYAAMPDTC